MKALLKFLPIETIIGYFFPNTLAAYHTWLTGKTPENVVALGEAAANELAGHFAPDLAPQLAHYEEIANPIIHSAISLIEAPSIKSGEVLLTEAVGLTWQLTGTGDQPDEVKAALANLLDVINKKIGV